MVVELIRRGTSAANTCPHEQRGVGLALAGAPQCSRPRCTHPAVELGQCAPHASQLSDEVRDVER